MDTPSIPLPLVYIDADGYALEHFALREPRRGHTRMLCTPDPLFWALASVLASPGTLLAVSM